MRKVLLLSVCVILIALVASSAASGRVASTAGAPPQPNYPCTPDDCGGGYGCAKAVHVTFQIFSAGQADPASFGNGCWGANAPKQNPSDWLVCNTDWSYSGNLYAQNWLYNETSFSHNNDTDVIEWCANYGYATGYGYVDMAYSPDYPHWKRVEPDGIQVKNYFAETYSYYLFDLWKDEYWIGRPMINIGPDSNLEAYNRTLDACSYIGSGKSMGIYSESPVMWDWDNGAKLQYVVSALNNCTT
jgi:hypothetical protein